MTQAPASYRKTLFDRHGPEAQDLVRSAGFGLMVFGLVIGGVAFASGGMSLGVVVVAMAAGAGTAFASQLLGRAAGGAARRFTAGSSNTPYQEQYSYQQALVMQGKVDEALASFESIAAAEPNAVQPRVRAAELYVQHRKDARRAAELLREAQRSPSIRAGEDVYVTNRLVDLLAGPLGDAGRACVELRKLIDRYPGSANAQRAREALARIKATLARGDDAVRHLKEDDGA